MKEKYNVIFLDIDGVLNSLESIKHSYLPDKAMLKRFIQLLKQTNSKIVITSGWRFSTRNLQTLFDIFYKLDIPIRGITPHAALYKLLNKTKFKGCEIRTTKFSGDLYIEDRGAEIAEWLIKHKREVKNFAILDDEIKDIVNYFPDNAVWTDCLYGLTDENCLQVKNILNKDFDFENWLKN